MHGRARALQAHYSNPSPNPSPSASPSANPANPDPNPSPDPRSAGAAERGLARIGGHGLITATQLTGTLRATGSQVPLNALVRVPGSKTVVKERAPSADPPPPPAPPF